MQSLVKMLFAADQHGRMGATRSTRSRKRVGKVDLGQGLRSLEKLESRLAMAVNAFTQLPQGQLQGGWVTLISDGGDDLYAQQIAPAAPGQSGYAPALLYADNGSFLDAGTVLGINNYSTVYVTNASIVSSIIGRESDGYPFVTPGASTSNFVLATDDVDDFESISGSLTNGVGGTWTFQNNPGPNGYVFGVNDFTSVVSQGPVPIAGQIFFRNRNGGNGSGDYDAIFEVTWDTPVVGPAGMDPDSPPVVQSITYDFLDDNGLSGFDPIRLTNIVASSFHSPSYTLDLPAGITPQDGAEYSVVAGSLSGRVFIEQFGHEFEFTTQALTGINGLRLVFRDTSTNPNTFTPQWNTRAEFETTGLEGDDDRFLTGTIGVTTVTDPITGDTYTVPTINLIFTGPNGIRQEVGPVRVTAEYAIYVEPEIGNGGDFTLFPGQDFTRSLIVDLLAPGATINMESPAVFESGVSPSGHFIDLSASNTVVNSLLWSQTSINVSDSNFGQGKAEQVFFNAAVAAQTYDIRVSDDLLTDAVKRSQVFVSTTGSLAGALPSSPAVTPINAQSIYVLSNTGDVFVEGKIAVNVQSYILQSPIEPGDPTDPFGTANRGPYYLSTVAQLSGANTGLLLGDSVAVTLGNDLPTYFDDAGNGGSTAFNVVTLQTDIASLRIQASDRKGNPIETPFPYDIQIEEANKLRVDAVAASTLPIVIRAEDDIDFKATLASAGDVTVDSTDGDVLLNAPLTTVFGTVNLAANRLAILNSVRVLDTVTDELRTDITLTSRDGDLQLTGPISAVNTIQLNQSGSGRIFGSTRVIADRLEVFAAGSADMSTDVRELSGQVDGGLTVNELDNINVTLLNVANGRFTITANGWDFDDDNDGVFTPALRATLADTTILTASAPNGSVNIQVTGAEKLLLGDKDKVSARTVSSMVAAGDVFIESVGGSIDVFDAPVAGSSAKRVRAATTGSLAGTFAPRTQGTFAATLTGILPLSSLNLLNGGLGIDGVNTLRVRDEILLKNQGNPEENGVYTIVNLGSSTSPWVLARSSDLDTSAEASIGTLITVNEGSQAGTVFRIASYDNAPGTTPRSVTTVTNRGSAVEVRAVSTTTLDARYEFDAVTGLGSIAALVEGDIPTFDGVTLAADDLVLVRLGTRDAGVTTNASNGVYRVNSVGGVNSTWELVEVPGVTEDLVAATEGTLRATRTGLIFRLQYNSLNSAGMNIEQAANTVKIGSQDINDLVRFIVSTNEGTNTGLGSLGKMISLTNRNAYMVEGDSFGQVPATPQRQEFGFVSTLRGPVRLTQELPVITKTMTIDATARRESVAASGPSEIFIDGSRVTQSADFATISPTAAVHGLRVAASANDTALVGLRLYGFAKGSAIRLEGADDVRIDQIKFGVDSTGRRAANKIGVEVLNDGGGFNTISNSTIQSSSVAGVYVDGSASGVRIAGSTIGGSKFENSSGVYFANGINSLGLNAVTATLRRVTATQVNATTFTLPANFASIGSLFVGQGVAGARIEPAAGKIASIASISLPDADGVTTVTIADGTITPGASTALLLDLGIYADFELGALTVTIPNGDLHKELFLGQTVSGAAISPGTRITKVVPGAGTTTITLSSEIIDSGPQLIDFGTPGRNAVLFNQRGAVLGAGTNRIINTDIGSNVFDGAVITGTNGATGAAKITGGTAIVGGGNGRVGVGGRTNAKDLALASNAIFGNGSAGIRIGSEVNTANVTIQGNRLGVTAGGSLNINRGGNLVGAAATQTTFLTTPITATGITELGQAYIPNNASPPAYFANRVIKVTVAAAHGLQTGHIVHLTFPAGSGIPTNGYRIYTGRVNLPAVTNAIPSVAQQSLSLAPNEFLILYAETTPAATTPTTAPVPLPGLLPPTIMRFGMDKAKLALTDQLDFEGNLHGLATTTTTTTTRPTTGGVAGRPVVIPPPPRRR